MIIISKQIPPPVKRKKTDESKIKLWDCESDEEEFSPYREKEMQGTKKNTRGVSRQEVDLETKQTDGDFFFEVKESQMHCRSSDVIKSESKVKLKSGWEGMEGRRRKRLERVQRMRTQICSIAPWDSK